MTQSRIGNVRADDLEIDQVSPERARAVNEVGAAIAHELNGPLTALLLYVGDLNQHRDQFSAENDGGPSLRRIVENAFRETERVCSSIRRIAEAFETPLQTEAAVTQGREIIGWWSRRSNAGADHTAAQEARSNRKPLTPREREVLYLVSEGCSNKQGGQQLQISHRTFESHRAAVMRKFGAKNAADLVRLSRLLLDDRGRPEAVVRG
jgi:DNA-binding CsgD family transcriptional regulator